MGGLASRRLRRRQVGRLVICNRTAGRAARLAASLGAECLPWEWRERLLDQADAVICATGARKPVVQSAWLERAARSRSKPLLVIDLAVPRNVEPPAEPRPGLSLIDVAELTRRLDEETRQRREAARAAEIIVEEVLGDWAEWALSRDGGNRSSRRGLAAG
jgi:glutamyl-tRNA reductase